ncbi:AcrR family transcriptional regulator [Bradyrhizobium sp. CIR48]|nr:AcrR family transcriptional regulator [Bradyrhizobium sp. CIR48]
MRALMAGLPCPLDPSDPVGLQAASLGSQNIWARLTGYAPSDEEKLNRVTEVWQDRPRTSGHGKSFLATSSCIRADPRVQVACTSGEMGEVTKGREAAEQAESAALLTGAVAARPPHPEGRPAFGKHAGNVAGICDAIDRRHGEPQQGAAKAGHEGGGVVDEGGGDINSEGLHFGRLQVNLNNVHMSSSKMNNVQEESLRDQKKNRRRLQILEIARGIIATKGLRSLKVRDVAEAAGCSVGSVYNEFGDFDGVILTVNRETVQALTARLCGVPAEDPVRQLYGLAETYLEFFAEHANLLRSLFEHRMEDDRPYPDDILQMVMDAFALMHPPLVRLLPDADDVKIALLSRTLFSAVHGIISLGLEERMVAVPPQMLRQQIEQFVDAHLAGLGILPVGARKS